MNTAYSDPKALEDVHAATFWERHTEALDALGRSADADVSRSRALALRARIADMGSD